MPEENGYPEWNLPETLTQSQREAIENMIREMEAAGVASQLICLAINTALAVLPGAPQIEC
jgi:hypothetical protein